jgi:subtilisin family serine protease
MNGKVSRASRAATMASKKGIIVVVAAGNEGNKAWHYIGSPADADEIVTVGAVQADSTSSNFSSFGPSSDNRVKPEICAVGSLSAIVNTSGTPTYGNGTSFASPIMAGMVACLLQRYKAFEPYPSVSVFLNSLFASGNLRNNPTAQKGYGIPNFLMAEQNLPVYNSLTRIDNDIFSLGYNSQNKTLNIRILNGSNPKQAYVRIYSSTGKLAFKQVITERTSYLELNKIPVGIYAVALSLNGVTETRKIIIQ